MRLVILRILLAIYFVASLTVAFPIALGIGHTGELAGTTSGKILASAIVALGVGALLAAIEPVRHRGIIVVIIAFTALACLAIVTRLIGNEHRHDPAAVLLPFVAACPVLLAVFFPWRRSERGAGA